MPTHETAITEYLYTSPCGTLLLRSQRAELISCLWTDEKPLTTASPADPILRATVGELDEYFAGERQVFDIVLGLHGTPFQTVVWQTIAALPYGQTMTYGEVARRIGRPGAARAVGNALNRNPISILLPCHRVVASNGALTGYAGGIEAKRWLLDHERQHSNVILRGL